MRGSFLVEQLDTHLQSLNPDGAPINSRQGQINVHYLHTWFDINIGVIVGLITLDLVIGQM